jgi:hypoxanthine phosphoribosyltransferase
MFGMLKGSCRTCLFGRMMELMLITKNSSTQSIEKPTTKLYASILYDPEKVEQRISELAQLIIRTYASKNPLFICLLRGGAPFSAKLMFDITAHDPNFYPELDYMTIRTYGDKLHPKHPEIIMDLSPQTKPRNRPVMLLDDVLDTGETTQFVSILLLERGATDIDLCVLVTKEKDRPEFNGNIFSGFDAPADWLTGMGLDDPRIATEANRWAQYIAIGNK